MCGALGVRREHGMEEAWEGFLRCRGAPAGEAIIV